MSILLYEALQDDLLEHIPMASLWSTIADEIDTSREGHLNDVIENIADIVVILFDPVIDPTLIGLDCPIPRGHYMIGFGANHMGVRVPQWRTPTDVNITNTIRFVTMMFVHDSDDALLAHKLIFQLSGSPR